ncbi:MAG: cytochrome c [Acidimicrobiales bacterium]
MLVASTQTAIGGVIVFVAIVLALAYAYINIRNSRAELGSEIELAANRKPYYQDEELEGRKLDRTLTYGLLGIMLVALSLPLYWLSEPGRQDGAIKDFNRKFADRGSEMFATTEEGGFNCAFCHGGDKAVGGIVDFTITDANGAFVKAVKWQAPALNTVMLRYSRAEVRYILEYGRPFSPMPPWGLKGGGALNDQQLQNLVDYLVSIQLTPEESQKQVTEQLAKMREMEDADGNLMYPASVSDGELLFNLGYDDNFAGGAYSCGRCHTTGWSYGDKGPDGNGAFGPALRDGATLERFPGAIQGPVQHRDFVCAGSEDGKVYGQNGQGNGRMPGFCQTPEEKVDPLVTGEVGVEKQTPSEPDKVGGMLTQDQVEAVIEYERGL